MLTTHLAPRINPPLGSVMASTYVPSGISALMNPNGLSGCALDMRLARTPITVAMTSTAEDFGLFEFVTLGIALVFSLHPFTCGGYFPALTITGGLFLGDPDVRVYTQKI